MRVFLTGGSGFIGSYLIRELNGNQILALTRKKLKSSSSVGVEWLLGDLVQTDRWEEKLIQFAPEVCIHLAWEGLPDYSKEVSEKNVKLSANLFAVLRRANVGRIVALGSCWEYGDIQGQVVETQDTKPKSHFAMAKVQVCESFMKESSAVGMEFVWQRIFFSYGPGQRNAALLPTVVTALENHQLPKIKSPDLAQDFVFISDVAEAIALTSTLSKVEGIFNVGSGQLTQVGDFVNLISAQLGSTFRTHVSGEPIGMFASVEKLKRDVGWKSKYSLQHGVAETVKALKKRSD
jgi:nucleoside-diphosphate-sugar epimerase